MNSKGTICQAGVPRSNLREILWIFITVALSATMACWPMLVNRQPFLLSDTLTYIRGADAAVYKMTGTSTDWTVRYRQTLGRAPVPGVAEPQIKVAKPVILAGRSIYYGALLYGADRLGGLRWAVVLQAILTATCLLLTIARFGQMPPVRAAKFLVGLTALLAIGSSLPFFVSYLEPDLTCALALLAASHLLTARPILSRRSMYFWLAVLSICTLMNSSTILILIVIAVIAGLGSVWTNLVCRRGIALLAASILIGISGEALFEGVVMREFGSAPVRPPFLMARLIADGPGRVYLQKHCPEARFTVCRYVGSISRYDSYAASDSFLWSHYLSNGVFSAVSPAERRQISAEEARFVVAVIEDQPVAVLKSSVNDVVEQSTKWRLLEFNVQPSQEKEFAQGLPQRIWEQQYRTLAFRQAMPVSMNEVLAFPLALLSLLLIFLSRRSWLPGSDLKIFSGVLMIGVASDVIVCGVMSTPHDRYLMRVAWLIPMACLVSLICWSEARIRSPGFWRLRDTSPPTSRGAV